MGASQSFSRLLFAIALVVVPQGLLTRNAAADDAAELGKTLFTQGAAPPCAVCHTLADAAAEGAIGPDLDQLKPDAARVKTVVRGGMGAMPAYDTLSDDELDAIATYVSTATSN